MAGRVITAVLIAAIWPAWAIAGIVCEGLGLDDLNIPLRVVLLFLLATASDVVLRRVIKKKPGGSHAA